MLNQYAIMVTNNEDNGYAFVPMPDKATADAVSEEYERCFGNVNIQILKANNVKLEQLPQDVQEDVKGTLRAFDECNVWYEYGRFHAMAGCGVKASYGNDDFWCNTYRNR